MKKKVIIWEENNEPPKNYIWAKPDGKFYEYNRDTRLWEESALFSGCNSSEEDDETLIPTDYEAPEK